MKIELKTHRSKNREIHCDNVKPSILEKFVVGQSLANRKIVFETVAIVVAVNLFETFVFSLDRCGVGRANEQTSGR